LDHDQRVRREREAQAGRAVAVEAEEDNLSLHEIASYFPLRKHGGMKVFPRSEVTELIFQRPFAKSTRSPVFEKIFRDYQPKGEDVVIPSQLNLREQTTC